MIEEIQIRKDTPKIVTNAINVEIMIPQCCREGWASCKHVPKLQRLKKKNIAL